MTQKKATMYRQGAGWIVSVWDAEVGVYRLSAEMHHTNARAIVGRANCKARQECGVASHYHTVGEQQYR